MTAVGLVGIPTVDSGEKNSFSPAAPTGIASGDHQMVVGAVGTGSETWGAAPTGFTLAWDSGSIGGTDTYRVGIWISNASAQTGAVAFTKSGTRHGHFVRAAWRGGTGFDLATDANAVTVAGNTHALPAQTTSGTDNTTVGVAVIDIGPPGGINTWTKPAAWDNQHYSANTHGPQPEDISIGIFSEVTAATATVVTGSAASSVSDVAAVWTARLAGFVGSGLPSASAGADAAFNAGGTFNRTATENANGSAITARQWKIQSGPDGVNTILDTDATVSWFPNVAGVYVLRYTVTNANGSGSDDVTVTVTALAPTVGAGADATIVQGTDFERVATENANGAGIANRGWKVVSAPAGGPAADTLLSTSTALDYTPPVSGVYVLQYFATNSVGTTTDNVQLTVTLAPPTANAGADIAFELGDSFNRNGTHVGAEISAREWSVVSGPSHVGQVLSTNAGISFQPPAIGTYVFRYRVTNPAGIGNDTVSVQVTAPPTPPEEVSDGWTYINVPWGDNELNVRDLAPGVEYEVQISAVDAANPPNRSPYSPSLLIDTPVDDLAPSIPAGAVVAASRNAVQVMHSLGKSTGGTSNLESDLNHLRVYLVELPGDPIDAVPVEDGGTLLGKVEANAAHLAAEVPVVATFPIPQVSQVWIRVTAVDNNGNESNPSVAVPVTADLLTDAYIANLSVSKVVAGTILANWVQAAEMNSGPPGSGSRFRLGFFGLELYNDLNQLTLDANTSDGSLFLVGTISTAVNGRRVTVDGIENEIAFFPQSTNTRKARIFSYIPSNFPDDIALEMRAVDSDTTDHSTRFYMLPDRVSMTISPRGDGGDFLGYSNVDVEKNSVDMTVKNIIGSPPYSGDEDFLHAVARVRNDGGEPRVNLFTYHSTAPYEPKNRLVMSDAGFSLDAQTQGTTDGGYIRLGRGVGNITSFGRSLNGDFDTYLTVDNVGDLKVFRHNILRIAAGADGVELRGTAAYASSFQGIGGGRAVLGTNEGASVFFYWSNGNIFLGSGANMLFNFAAVNTLLNANIINRLNTAETNISTLFGSAHNH